MGSILFILGSTANSFSSDNTINITNGLYAKILSIFDLVMGLAFYCTFFGMTSGSPALIGYAYMVPIHHL